MDADTFELLQTAARAAAEKKAFKILGLDLSGLTSFTDAFLLCSASSGPHLQAVADEIQRRLKHQRKSLNLESSADSWILMDYGDFVLHLFTEERRDYYKLESLWGDAPQLEFEGLDQPEEGP